MDRFADVVHANDERARERAIEKRSRCLDKSPASKTFRCSSRFSSTALRRVATAPAGR
jgi:hypothetical protein